MSGTTKRRCHCRNPETGKEYGSGCPRLKSSKHGEWEFRDRLPTTTGRRSYRRGGFTRQDDATQHGRAVHNLLDLAHKDPDDEARVGDLLFRIKRGQPLPRTDEVRRRLGLRGDLHKSQTVAEWLNEWLGGKRALRDSTRETYRSHIDTYLIPFLGDFALDRLQPEHISAMFDTIGEWNTEIEEAREEGRKPLLEGDIRKRKGPVGNTTQRRIFATLRVALNSAFKARRVDINQTLFVEMPPEENAESQVWDGDQVGTFLDAAEGDELALMFRIILVHGPRRGEAVGARWSDLNEETGVLTIEKTVVSLSGRIGESKPKTSAGKRVLHLDDGSRDLLRRHRVKQAAVRLAMGEAFVDRDLIFCRSDGSPHPPDLVSRHFREITRRAGLPAIRLHDARHTAATLALEANIDIKIVSKRMGHTKTGFTRDRYQHVRPAMLDDATERVVALLPERHRRVSGGA